MMLSIGCYHGDYYRIRKSEPQDQSPPVVVIHIKPPPSTGFNKNSVGEQCELDTRDKHLTFQNMVDKQRDAHRV